MNKLFLCIMAVCANFAQAEATESFKVSGSFDSNYVFNLNQPRQVTQPSDTNLTQPAGNNRYRAFDLYHDNFNVALVEIDLEKHQGPVVAFVALGFGHTADVLSPRDEVSKHLLQAHLTYTPPQNPRLSLTAGKMFTHMGLEVARTRDNWNYSRSILFSYAIPFWHTGVAARYDILPENLKGALFVYNETVGLYEIGRGKTYGAQLLYSATENFNLTYNFLAGNEISSDEVSHNRFVHELIPIYTISPSLALNADVVFGQLSRARSDGQKNAQWIAWSAGLKWTCGNFYLSPRYEIYTDRAGATVETATTTKPALPQRISSSTLTSAYSLGDGLETRFEVRRDHSSNAPFTDSDNMSKTTQTTLTLGLLYDF